MSKQIGFILENNEGKVIRYLSSAEDQVCVVIDKRTHRLRLINKSVISAEGSEHFDKIKDIKASSVEKRKISINSELTLKAYDPNQALKGEIQAAPEDEDRLPVYLKYSAIGNVAAILLVIMTSFIINKYFNEDNEPVVVQVFQQKPEVQPRNTVNASKKKITRRVVRKAKVSNRTKVAKSTNSSKRKSNRNSRQASQNINNMGALGVLGGASKNMSGSGGLNMKAAKNNAGSGYGGAAAKGGHSRALVGKGLVASGSGNTGSVQGYGGYGTKGQGGGQPGYGNRKIVGSSSGSLYALSDEALIEGGLDMDQINAVVQRNKGQLRQCYERALQQNSGLSGSVNIKFVIAASGSVSTARVGHTSLGQRAIESCMVSKLRGWRFPKPVGNVSVRVDYPFVFKRNG